MSQNVDPEILVLVELSPEFDFLADPARKISQRFRDDVGHRLAKVLHQCGIPGEPRVEVKSKDGVRVLEECELYEVSLCAWGANPNALVTGVSAFIGSKPATGLITGLVTIASVEMMQKV